MADLLEIIAEDSEIQEPQLVRTRQYISVFDGQVETLETRTGLFGNLIARIINDALNIEEPEFTATNNIVSVLDGSIEAAESIIDILVSSVTAIVRHISESIGISDGDMDVLLLYLALVDESVSEQELGIRIRGMHRFRAESLSVAESVIRRVGAQIVRIIDDTISLVETIVRRGRMRRFSNETVQLPESRLSLWGTQMVRVIADPLSIGTDSLRSIGFGIIRVVNEALTATEIIGSTLLEGFASAIRIGAARIRSAVSAVSARIRPRR